MSHLLYLHSFAGSPGKKRKPISPMGLGRAVLEAYAPRFKKAGAQAWLALLTKDEGPVVLEPARVAELAKALAEVAALAGPKLKCAPADVDEFEQVFIDELLAPITSLVKKGGPGLFAEWC